MGELEGREMLGVAVLMVQAVSLVRGHGNMVIPFTWHDKEMLGMEKKNVGCVKEELPDHDEEDDWPTIHGRNVCQNEWFTNHTYIPGEATIPEDMLGPGGHGRNPWYAPGTAPVYSPCGTYGDCCARDRCGGFALGPNAGSVQEV